MRTFETVEERRLALIEFRKTYNATWLIERLGFITPAAVGKSASTRRTRGVGFNRCLRNRGR